MALKDSVESRTASYCSSIFGLGVILANVAVEAFQSLLHKLFPQSQFLEQTQHKQSRW